MLRGAVGTLMVEDRPQLAAGLGDAADVLGTPLRWQLLAPALEEVGEPADDRCRGAQVVDQLADRLLVTRARRDGCGHRSARSGSSAISPRSRAIAMACTRLRAWSLRITLRTWVRTVSTETLISEPIASAVRPSAIRCMISRSRGESWGRRAVARGESRIRSRRGSTYEPPAATRSMAAPSSSIEPAFSA